MGIDALVAGAEDLIGAGAADAGADAAATAAVSDIGGTAAVDAGTAAVTAGAGDAATTGLVDTGLGAAAAGAAPVAAEAGGLDALGVSGGGALDLGGGVSATSGLGEGASALGAAGGGALDLTGGAGVASGLGDVAAGGVDAGLVDLASAGADIISGGAPATVGAGGIDSSLAPVSSDAGSFDPNAMGTLNPSGVNSPDLTGDTGLTGNASVDNALKQLGGIGSSALKYAPLAGLGLNYEAYKKGQSAQQQLKNVAAPASAVSQQLLGQYQTGTINASDAFQIQQYTQQQTAALQQYYASAGLSNSSMEAEAIGQVQAQAQAMRAQAVQNLLSGGLQAAGVAQGPQIAAVQASVQADQALSAASANFMNALAKMNTSGTTPATTGT